MNKEMLEYWKEAIQDAGWEILNCPFCGKEPSWIGPRSMMVVEVKCQCGASVSFDFPKRYPKIVQDNWSDDFAVTNKLMLNYCLTKAIKKWNQRKP